MAYLASKELCTGCSACYAICPLNCIEMIKNDEGFLYPVIGEKCINCGKCSRVCPQLNRLVIPDIKTATFPQQAFAGLSKSYKTWRRSSSGGAFSEICAAWDDGETLFFGASWEGFKVKHICVKGVSSVGPLCKSKYLSSDLSNSFFVIKKHLDGGGRALFCGTPCQVSGLKAFLGREYDKLLLIDLVCHGVGSPLVFEKCIEVLENQFGKSILSYCFRAKRYAFERDHLTKIKFSLHKGTLFLNDDQYIQLFTKQICLRSSCGANCIYRNEHRQGDITIADFKSLIVAFPQLEGTKRNYSSIIVNSHKGALLLSSLKRSMHILPCSVDTIKISNPIFFRQTWFSKDRDAFFLEFKNNPLLAIKRFTTPATISKRNLKTRVYELLPVPIRRKLINLSKHGDISSGKK